MTRRIALFAGLAALAALVLLPGLLIGPSLDAAVFGQVSHQLTDGSALYTAAWDHKPPGIYLLLAGLQLAMPFLDPWPIAWGVTVLATAGTGTALSAAARGIGVSGPVAFSVSVAAVIAMAQYLLSLGGGLTESLATFPLAVALALALAPAGRGLGRDAVIGALLSAAVLLSLQVVAAAAVLAGLAVWRVGRAARLPVIGGMLVGALIPLLVAVTPLVLSRSLQAAVDAVLGYSAAYGAIEAPAGERLFAPLVAWSLLALLFLIVPAVLGAARMLRTPGLRRVVAVACVAWIGLSIGLFVYQGRFYGHYAIPLVVPMAVLAGPGIERALRGTAGGRLGRGIRLAPLLVGGLVSVLAGVAAGRMEADAVSAINARARAVAEVLDETTDPGDRLWVWGNAPQLYLAAERPQATPYAYLFPLVTPGYATPAKVEAALADLAADPPRVIVDAGSPAPGSPGFQQLLIPRPLASDGRDLDILDPLRAFVRENYEQGPIIDGWVIYRLLTDPAAS